MRPSLSTVLCSLALCLLCGCSDSRDGQVIRRGAGQQDVQMVQQGNAKMEAAYAEARRTAPEFIQKLKAPVAGRRYLVKVRVSDGSHTEYMWIGNLTHDGTRFSGRLVDDPYEVKGYRAGQTLTVPTGEIHDWLIFADDKIQEGGFTEKVLNEMR
jgi:uncharacterized protein YegJ (DUF2314 family)